MKKLTDKQLDDYEFLSNVIASGEIPYTDPEGDDPYLWIDNLEYRKEELEEDVTDALARGETEYSDALDAVVVHIKKHIESLGYKVSEYK